MKKLTSKKKIRQILMFKKNLKKMEKRKNKTEKDKKEAAEKQRILPRSRQRIKIIFSLFYCDKMLNKCCNS